MADLEKKTYSIPKKLATVFTGWCKPGRDYSPKVAGAVLLWMGLDPVVREQIIALAYSDNIKQATSQAQEVLTGSIVTDEGLDITTAVKRVKNAIVAYSILSDTDKATVDEFLNAMRSILAADLVSDAAERDTKGGKRTTRRRGSSKPA